MEGFADFLTDIILAMHLRVKLALAAKDAFREAGFNSCTFIAPIKFIFFQDWQISWRLVRKSVSCRSRIESLGFKLSCLRLALFAF